MSKTQTQIPVIKAEDSEAHLALQNSEALSLWEAIFISTPQPPKIKFNYVAKNQKEKQLAFKLWRAGLIEKEIREGITYLRVKTELFTMKDVWMAREVGFKKKELEVKNQLKRERLGGG